MGWRSAAANPSAIQMDMSGDLHVSVTLSHSVGRVKRSLWARGWHSPRVISTPRLPSRNRTPISRPSSV
jgi:hypothetical protein